MVDTLHLPSDDLGTLADAMEILGIAAWQGMTFTAEVVAAVFGMDADVLIGNWLDRMVVRADRDQGVVWGGAGFLVKIDQPDNLPHVGGRSLHGYRFTSSRIWATWREKGIARDELLDMIPIIIGEIEATWMHPGMPASLHAEITASLVDLYGRAAQLTTDPSTRRDWVEQAGRYEWQKQAPDDLVGRAWQLALLEREAPKPTVGGGEGDQPQPADADEVEARDEARRSGVAHDRVEWFETLMSLAIGTLDALARSDSGGVAAARRYIDPAESGRTSGRDEITRLATSDVVQYIAAASDTALAMDDADRQARTHRWGPIAQFASALFDQLPHAQAAQDLADILHAGRPPWEPDRSLDTSALPDERWAVLTGDVQAILENAAVPQAERIAAGLILGELGDPRFEDRDGPLGAYVEPPLVPIPAGLYVIGSRRDDTDALSDEYDQHTVALDAFEIGRYPVTNAEFRCFIEAGGYDDPQWWDTPAAENWRQGSPEQAEIGRAWWRGIWQKMDEDPEFREAWVLTEIPPNVFDDQEQRDKWMRTYRLPDDQLEDDVGFRRRREGARFSAAERSAYLNRWHSGAPQRQPEFWEDPEFDNPSQPVVGVSWYEARAYCLWLSAQTGWDVRLPSEVEWEAAARGVGGRRYAFGDDFNRLATNTAEAHVGRTSPVGAFPAGRTPEGDGRDIEDLCGNVCEWTRSLYRDYPYDPEDTDREDMAAPAERVRVVRGGSWHDPAGAARCAYRLRLGPGYRGNVLGFRVVVAPPTLSR